MSFLPVGLTHYLVVAAALFSIGLFGVVTRRNAVAVLLSVELILNSANINFVAFSHFMPGSMSGNIFAMFVVILAAAEAAVGLSIVLVIYKTFSHINVDDVSELRE